MSCDRSVDRVKWSCEYCTYDNFPASKKCTLCRAPRQPQYIDRDDDLQSSHDIYKMAPLMSGGTAGGQSSPGAAPPDTWTCRMCTFINQSRAANCVQCLTSRAARHTLSSTPSVAPTSPLSIDVNESCVEQSMASAARAPARNSPSSPEAAKATNNNRNRAVMAAEKAGSASGIEKWTCKACTYDNWPRSLKCVICGVTKSRSAEILVPSSSSPTNTDKENSPGSDSESQATRSGLVGSSRGPSSANNRTLPPLSSSATSSRNPAAFSTIEGAAIDVGGAAASVPPLICERGGVGGGRRGGAGGVNSDDSFKPVVGGGGHNEDKRHQWRNRLRDIDWLWLTACQAVVDGDTHAVESYLAAGGDPRRQMTAEESTILGRPSAFTAGYTLVHLAVRFQREDILSLLLAMTDNSVTAKARKRTPSYAAPDIAAEIMRDIAGCMRQRKGDFPCYFSVDIATFALPAEISDFPNAVKKQLFDELLDRNAQKELEDEEPVINWSAELTDRLESRLYPLWNRTAGDCLLDSLLQVTWGVMDRDNTLRRALADSLTEGATTFFPRFKDTEALQAEVLNFSIEDRQFERDWAYLLSLANKPGVYLPLLWEQSFCFRTPVALGYTRGHFNALVPLEVDQYASIGARANIDNAEDTSTAYLPLIDYEGKILPIHFLQASELGHEELLLREWLDCCFTDGGLLVAKQQLRRPPMLVHQMLDEWLHRYRKLAHIVQSATTTTTQQQQQQRTSGGAISSEDESDDE